MAKHNDGDERQERFIQLTLEQLNHEKANLKVQMRKIGTALSSLRKQAGDLNETYEELDKEMLRRDETYRQLELNTNSDE